MTSHSAPAQVSLTLKIADDLKVFEGHFEGLPIVPGVAQVDWAMRFAQQYLHQGLPCRELRQLKFTRPMRPPCEPTLQLWLDAPNARLRFEFADAKGVYSQGLAVLG